jgi:hypothetical protein
MKVFKTTFLFLTVTLLSSPAFSQGTGGSKPPVEKRKTLSFEDELVEGATQKPELFYLFQKKNFNYKKLIKLRENFLPEMRKTSEELQRTRGNN